MKLLVISLAGIGDTLFATPLIHELRANFPDAQIDALVMWRGSRDLLEGNPHLNTVHHKNLITASKGDALKFLLDLRKQRYDASFNTHPQSRIHYRVVARVIGARLRTSHRYDNSTSLDRLFVNRSLPQDYQRHAIDNNLALLGFVNARPLLPRHEYELFLTGAEQKWAADFVAAHALAQKTVLGLHVGSGGTKNLALRRWPVEHFIDLIQRLGDSHPRVSVLLFGGPEEVEAHRKILARVDRNRVFAPETANLRQAAALLRHCTVFLSVDTALMHLAATMKVPHQVVIETPTWNQPIEPYGNPFTLVTNPAVAGRHLEFYRYDGDGIKSSPDELARCMASVTVESVHSVLAEKLGAARA